jgi:hypothetical protein
MCTLAVSVTNLSSGCGRHSTHTADHLTASGFPARPQVIMHRYMGQLVCSSRPWFPHQFSAVVALQHLQPA